MNDILPPKKRPLSPQTKLDGQQIISPTSQIRSQSPLSAQKAPVKPKEQVLLESAPPKVLLESPKRSRKKLIWGIISGILLLAIIACCGLVFWYNQQLRPLSPGDTSKVKIEIVSGASPAQIGQLLEDKKIIRSKLAFDVYTRLSNAQAQLQAGPYNLSPSESTQQIVTHLTSGTVDEFAITFLPGATLADNRKAFIDTGYQAAEVDAALTKIYDHPLFAGKPANTDLEGYIFGETYHFDSDTSVEEILERTFDEFYKVIQDNNLVAAYKDQGLTPYEGITLASIIQREVSRSSDQKQVAQVFYKRLRENIPLGADATFVYGAKKLGIEPRVDVDSPYNTRIHSGLPPGPIATPGVTALQAVASPAPGDYLYFVSGDDGVSHFSYTQEEHDAKASEFCKVNCALF